MSGGEGAGEARPPQPPDLGGSRLAPELGGRQDASRYQVQAKLGSGATASVWSLHDLSLERPLAAKVLDQAQGEGLAAFLAEARTTAALEHPNVLPVHDVDLCRDGRPFFTMKRIEGQSLGGAIAASSASARHAAIRDANAVVSIALAVANALSYAHSRRIVHQDVKPDNVMLGGFGEVLLVDWGSAQDLGKGAPRLYGTPLYMSPEQARNEGVDERSDVYCLGATLFHALTLRLPTLAEDMDAFWRRKRAGEIDPPTAEERRQVPGALLAIALKAMAAEPGRRYPTMEALAADLRAYQAGQAVSAQPEGWWWRLARWFRRHARVFAVVTPMTSTAALLALVLFGDQLKAMATWGAPVLREDFADPALPGWTAIGLRGEAKRFAVRGGAAVTIENGDSLLVLRQRFEGDVRIEYDCWYEPDVKTLSDLSLLWCPEIAFDPDGATTQTLERAVQFEFGVHDAEYTAIQAWHHIVYDTARPAIGRRYHVRIEIRDNVATLVIDGVERCRYVAPLPIGGGHLVLYGWDPGKAFAGVRAWVREVPKLVPATAVGDWLLRDRAYDRAAGEYARVADSHPGTELARQALFREGLARWSAKDRPGAEDVWKLLAGTPWAGEAELVRIESAIGDGDYAAARDGIDRLAAAAPALTARLGDLWCAAVDALSQTPVTSANRAAMEAWMALRDRRFAARPGGRLLGAKGLYYLERYQEILDRFGEMAWYGTRALAALGRPEEALTRYPEARISLIFILRGMGRDDEVARMLGGQDSGMLIEQGRAEEVYRSNHDDVMAAQMVGDFSHYSGDPRESIYGDLFWQRFMVYHGRAREIREDIAADSVYLLMALGRCEEAAALGETRPTLAVWPRQALGMRAWISGRRDEAERWFAVPPEREFNQELVEPARTLIVPLLRELSGDRGAVERACRDVAARFRWSYRQQAWYAARYLLGEIDDAEFAAQPQRRFIDGILPLARGVRAEHRGRPAEALAAYRAWLAVPPWRRGQWDDPFADAFVGWRVAELGQSAGDEPRAR